MLNHYMHPILPGEEAGGIRLGTAYEQVLREFGIPQDSSRTAAGIQRLTYDGIAFLVGQDGVVQIEVFDPYQGATPQGIQVGMDRESFITSLGLWPDLFEGDPGRLETPRCPGMVFLFGSQDEETPLLQRIYLS